MRKSNYIRVENRRDRANAVYRHFDADGNLLYVGQSLSLFSRLYKHMAQTDWATSIRTIKVEWYSSRDEALRAESRAISTESPRYNDRLGVSPDDPRLRRKGRRENTMRELEQYMYQRGLVMREYRS